MGALRPPGRTAVRVAGDDLQWLHVWEACLAALIDRAGGVPNPVVRVGVEVAGVGNVDDVVRYRQRPPHSYSQVKYAVDARTAVNEDYLLTKSRSGGPSILEKVVQGWRRLTADGAPVDLSLITNRHLDFADPLVSGCDSRSLLLVPAAAEGGTQSVRGKARRRWAKATGLTERELLDLLEVLRFDCGFSLARMRELLSGKMRSVGLPGEDQDINVAAAWVAEQVRDGVTEIGLEAIDRAVERLWPTAKLVIGPERTTAPLAGATEAGLKERLGLLPRMYEDQAVAAWRDYPEDTWRLVTALTGQQPLPTAVVTEWADGLPPWLAAAAPAVQLLGGELAGAYRQLRLMADLVTSAVAGGAVRAEFWLARAMLIYDEVGDEAARDRLLEQLEGRQLTEPYARAAVLSLSGDHGGALAELEQWAAQPGDRAIRALAHVRVIMSGEDAFTPANLDLALRTTVDGLNGPVWSTAVAVVRARLLAVRARLGRAGTWDRDLREAATLLLRVRQERRVIRGNSAEAVAQLCKVLLAQNDHHRLVQVATCGDDGATRSEADHPQVVEYLAVAALHLGDLDLARDCLRRLSDPAAHARISALIAEAQGEDEIPYWRAAVETATDDDQLAQALHGLALTGTTDLPRLEELAARHPDAAEDIRVLAEASAGEYETAVSALRVKASGSPTAAVSLSRVYGEIGRIDDQVETLTAAARTFGDNSLLLSAAEVLIRAERWGEAEAVLNDALTRSLADGALRARALRMAAHVAEADRRLHDAADRLRNALEIEPDDVGSRWSLIGLLLHRGELDPAWQELTAAPEPLQPATIGQARLWINLHVRRGRPPVTVAGCLELLRRFSDDPDFSAFAVTNLIMPGTVDDTVPLTLQEEMRQEISRYFDRWPAGPIRQITFTDPADVLAQVGELMSSDAERRKTIQSIKRGILTGNLPLSFLATAAGRSYCEVLITRAALGISARHPDPNEHASCLEAARAAADTPIIIDATAAVVLTTLPVGLQGKVLGAFSRICTTDAVTVDALAARDVLALRSTGHFAYDEKHGAVPVEHTTPAEADRLAGEAEMLLALIYQFDRVPGPVPSAFAFEDAPPLTTWTSAADLAHREGRALWSDDPVLRVLARKIGVPATSTPAILDHLHATHNISDADQETAVRELITASIGDFPLKQQRLLELGKDDRWQPHAVARLLARPATWATPSASVGVFSRLVLEIHAHQPDALPAWLYAAVHGAATAMAHQRAASIIAGKLLAIGLTGGRAHPNTAVNLTTATRQALTDSADPDGPVPSSPLPTCAKVLMEVYSSQLQPAQAAQAIVALFSSHNKEDREEILETIFS